MANYSTNQNRQLYVATSFSSETPTEQGGIALSATADNKQVFLTHYGAGGLTRSDIIDVKSIVYAKITEADDMKTYLKTATVSLNANINDGEPVAGQDYVLRIYIYNYLAIGDANIGAKYGMVHAYTGMTSSDFYTALAESLRKNFSAEVTPLLSFEATDSGVTITEVEQPWVPGTMSQEPVNFKVLPVPIVYEGDEVLWADPDNIKVVNGEESIGNGKKIADLEWFCHGERGDQYRGVGYPNVIRTRYEVDPDEEYNVLDLHYFYLNSGVDSVKSEKDLTIVSTDVSVLESIKSALEDYGVTFVEDSESSSEDSSSTESTED